VSESDYREQPYLAWNAFINLVGASEYTELTPVQRVARLAFLYDAAVQNGGHLQYFENHRLSYLKETLAALKTIGANCQHDLLVSAARRWKSSPRKIIRTVAEYVARARQEEFSAEDSGYYQCRPEICTDLLERYL